MRKPVISGMLLAVTFVMLNTTKAQALDPAKLLVNEKPNIVNAQMIDEPLNKTIKETIFKTASAESKPVPEELIENKYIVADGDSLSKIATKYGTTWERIFFKNTQIEDPNVITPNEEIIIPNNDEELIQRSIPIQNTVEVKIEQKKPNQKKIPEKNQTTNSPARGSSAGNTYSYGYCTWYVKNRRPDLPNNLGNANTWVSRAAAQGIPTGNTPRAGAVGQAGMHVVYVESVNGDGTITVSEMNRVGWNVQSSRTVSASTFMYIY